MWQSDGEERKPLLATHSTEDPATAAATMAAPAAQASAARGNPAGGAAGHVSVPVMPPGAPGLLRLFSLTTGPARRAALDDLPEPAIVRLAGFLTVADVGALARSNRALHRACVDESIWEAIYQRDFQEGAPASRPTTATALATWNSAARLIRQMSAPRATRLVEVDDAAAGKFRSQYKERHSARTASIQARHPETRDEQRRAQIAARAQGLAFVRSAKCRWYIDALHLYGVQSLNVVFALAFFLLVGLKMDGYLGSLSWFVVFIPVYLIAAVLLAACWVSAQVVWRDEGDQPSVWTGQKMGDKGTMLGVLLDAFFDCFREMGSGDGFRNKFKWVVLGSVVLCAVLLPCVIPAKLDAPDSAAWAVWLLPLWILICCVNCCAIGAITMSDGVGGDTVLVWSILSCAFAIPTLSVVIPIVAKYDTHADFSLFYPFIPVFFMFLFACGFLCFGIFLLIAEGGNDPVIPLIRRMIATGCITVVCSVIWISFASLRSMGDLPDMPALGVVAPLMAIMVALWYLCRFGSKMLMADREQTNGHWSNFYRLRRWEVATNTEEVIAIDLARQANPGLQVGPIVAAVPVRIHRRILED